MNKTMYLKALTAISLFCASAMALGEPLTGDICKALDKKLADPKFEYKEYFPSVYSDPKKILFGQDELKYNNDDFYLDTYAYDINNDGVSDLVAIDYAPRGPKNYYWAFYLFPGKGELHADRTALRGFLNSKRYLTRHGDGEIPVFAERIDVPLDIGIFEKISFAGYFLNPINFGNKTVLLAEKRKSSSVRQILFDFSADIHAPSAACVFNRTK
jgi:hypothetical protein